MTTLQWHVEPQEEEEQEEEQEVVLPPIPPSLVVLANLPIYTVCAVARAAV